MEVHQTSNQNIGRAFRLRFCYAKFVRKKPAPVSWRSDRVICMWNIRRFYGFEIRIFLWTYMSLCSNPKLALKWPSFHKKLANFKNIKSASISLWYLIWWVSNSDLDRNIAQPSFRYLELLFEAWWTEKCDWTVEIYVNWRTNIGFHSGSENQH